MEKTFKALLRGGGEYTIVADSRAHARKELERLGFYYVEFADQVLRVERGKVIHHGACVACIAQEKYGLEYCIGCRFKDQNWDLLDKSVPGPGEFYLVDDVNNWPACVERPF